MLLPDTQSSVRWEQFDRKYLDQAFTAAGVEHTIVNAQGDPAQQRTQAEQAMTNGAKVILLVDLDPGSGKSIIALAHARGAKVIDYDRLTSAAAPTTTSRSTTRQVGKLQGQGLVKCIKAAGVKPIVAELNGSPTDNNATLFAKGYNSVLDPKYADGTYIKGPNQSVPDWDNQKALTIYEQMLQKNEQQDRRRAGGQRRPRQRGDLGAQDRASSSSIPVTGQDATAEGIQNILAGEQCMTVYKAVKKEADAASAARDRAGEGPDARRARRRRTTRARRRRRCCSPPWR